MILHSYRGRRVPDGPKSTTIEAPGVPEQWHRKGAGPKTLQVTRQDGTDVVFVTILGQRGGVIGSIGITPDVVSALVQEMVGRELHLTAAMQERLRADKQEHSNG